MLKVRRVIAEIILLLKYKKWGITAALIGKDALMLLLTVLRKSWICQVLPFIVSRDISPIGNNVDDREFYLSVDHELYTRLGIGNCTSVWSPDKFVRKLMLVGKSDTEAFFFMRFEIQ